MTKYTAQDFADARFAEHEGGNTAARKSQTGQIYPWTTAAKGEFTDAEMALQGWVPVPTKPTITESELDAAIWDGEGDYRGDLNVANSLGIEVVPDPEPTNTERLEQLLASYDGYGMESTFAKLATHLNDHGVTAPKEDK